MKKQPLRIVTCCLAGALLFATPVYIDAAPVAGITEYTNTIIENELNTSSPVAGVSLTISSYLEENVSAQMADARNVDSSEEEKETGKKNQEDEKSSKYDNMAVAKVNDYVNIRRKPDEDSKLLGKLYSNSVATVLGKKDGWVKIQSGSVTGYVKKDYIVIGDEELIKSVGTPIATVSTTTLKVRSKASGKSDVLTLVPGGEALTVKSMKDYKDGWVKVAVEDKHGYVSADYIELTREYTYAESKAEEDARIALEKARIEEEQRAAQAALDAQNNTADTSSNTTNDTQTNTNSTSSVANTSNSTVSSAGTTANTGSTTGAANSSSSSGSTNSSSTNTSTSSGSSSSTSTSSSGQAVVNYASQFVGNPYVWGGSSLTNGTDCSGFVMSVYAHFGVSLPHYTGALCSVGYGVSYEDRQPGDIICYDGHVGIYVGNDTIIHASNPATGIKYTSPANYRPVVAVRRIF